MDTAGARRLNYSSPSGLNSRARRTDFYLGLFTGFLRGSGVMGCNLTVIIEQGQITPRYGSSRVRSRRSAFTPDPRRPPLHGPLHGLVSVPGRVLHAGSLVRRFRIPPPEFPILRHLCRGSMRFSYRREVCSPTLLLDHLDDLGSPYRPPPVGRLPFRCSSADRSVAGTFRCAGSVQSARIERDAHSSTGPTPRPFAGARRGSVTRGFAVVTVGCRGGPHQSRKAWLAGTFPTERICRRLPADLPAVSVSASRFLVPSDPFRSRISQLKRGLLMFP